MWSDHSGYSGRSDVYRVDGVECSKDTPFLVRREGQEDSEMNHWKSKERNQRVRDILNMMDKSIDRARQKREEIKIPRAARSGLAGLGIRGMNENGEPRLPSSMFDRSGPILKAKPKTSG